MRPRALRIAILPVLATSLLLGGCGGGTSKTPAGKLHTRLLPASLLPGFTLQRTFDWSDRLNLAGEGIVVPEATHPTQVVKAIDDAGFAGAAGERFAQGAPPNETDVTNGVVKLGSAAGAKKLQSFMHGQDLQQPCFTACIYAPATFSISGVPGVTAVKQVPHAPPGAPPPPKNAPAGSNLPPVHYLAEFTVGPYLYFLVGDGMTSDQPKVVATVQAYYKRVSALR